jgi:hypothetical protein
VARRLEISRFDGITARRVTPKGLAADFSVDDRSLFRALQSNDRNSPNFRLARRPESAWGYRQTLPKRMLEIVSLADTSAYGRDKEAMGTSRQVENSSLRT